MTITISDRDIGRFIEEYVPYGDLTTRMLGMGGRPGRIVFSTREEIILCGTEEAARVLQKCGATLISCIPRDTKLAAGVELPVAQGSAQELHAGWNVALNLLEYASGNVADKALIHHLKSEKVKKPFVPTDMKADR